MSIKKITYRAADVNMGDITSEECEQYREWAHAEIESEYPGAEVSVLNEDRNTEVEIDGGRMDSESDQEWIDTQEFLASLWDKCPWCGDHFE